MPRPVSKDLERLFFFWTVDNTSHASVSSPFTRLHHTFYLSRFPHISISYHTDLTLSHTLPTRTFPSLTLITTSPFIQSLLPTLQKIIIIKKLHLTLLPSLTVPLLKKKHTHRLLSSPHLTPTSFFPLTFRDPHKASTAPFLPSLLTPSVSSGAPTARNLLRRVSSLTHRKHPSPRTTHFSTSVCC